MFNFYQGKNRGGLCSGLRILGAWSVQNQRKRQSEMRVEQASLEMKNMLFSSNIFNPSSV